MIVDYNQMPEDVWRNIASHGSENAIVRVSKNLNKFISVDLVKIKTVYDQFIGLQSFFNCKTHYFDDAPFKLSERVLEGNFCIKKGFEIKVLDLESTSNCTIRADLGKTEITLLAEENKNASFMDYYIMPHTANLVHLFEKQVKKIHVTINDNLDDKRCLILQRAEKFANLYLSPPEEEKQVSSISSFW